MQVDPKRDVIEILLPFWDSTNNVFVSQILSNLRGNRRFYWVWNEVAPSEACSPKGRIHQQMFSTLQHLQSQGGIIRQRPKRSVKKPIDHEAEIKIKVELAMHDYLAKNHVLRVELELARGALTQQRVKFEKERANETQRETLLQVQVNMATIRGAHIAKLAVSRQQQLRAGDQKSQINFDLERAQWIRETRVHHLADRAAQIPLNYQKMNHEQFLAEVPEFAKYLTTLLQDMYQSVGGRLRPQSLFDPYANTSSITRTSTVCPLSTPMMSNPLFVPTELTNNVLQPTMVPKSNKDPPSKIPRDRR
ncbi:hypothetical protein RDI58_007115 [Solanum bulbocastanum]|uniref:Uncharacterized protein n=1 Tax=Solanum bulbocastanum TaxID=147425 RepID=A0AAN8YIK4_SOLBU